MKVVYVVDCVTDLTKKINAVTNKFGTDIVYVVRADLVDFFKTYGFLPNAIYYNNLVEVIHSLLLKSSVEDVIICYASLKFDNNLLTKFTNAIGDRSRIVNISPQYNTFEQVCNSAYNVYVKSLFKLKDSLATPKLQFIPSFYMVDLLSSHLGNRMFELNPEHCRTITVDDKEINKSMKTKNHSLKYDLISIIIALLVTVGLLASIAYYKVSYLIILTCIILYVLDITLTIIFHCKAKFDQRFLK
ncbi:MAG: hypothetical protein IJW36_01220 [Clostridia bacterium]|nr:hypothetical protein [Clostridia bacterium]